MQEIGRFFEGGLDFGVVMVVQNWFKQLFLSENSIGNLAEMKHLRDVFVHFTIYDDL